MQRMVLRFVALAATAVFAAGACSSAATPAPTQPPANASATPATVVASDTASSTPVPSAASATASAVAPGLGGTWDGTWKDTTPDQSNGTFVITWTQNGNVLSGNIVVNGTPCLSGGKITGAVNGSTISFGAVSGATTIAYDGAISGNTMKGTYAAAASCASAKGTWEAVKK